MKEIKIEVREFLEGLKKVRFILDKERNFKGYYDLVSIIIKNNNVNFVAFNTQMVGYSKVVFSNPNQNNQDFNLFVHKIDIDRIYKMLKSNRGDLSIVLDKYFTTFMTSSDEVTVENFLPNKHILNANDLKEKFSSDANIIVEIDKKTLSERIKQLIKNDVLLFKIDKGTIIIADYFEDKSFILSENAGAERVEYYEIFLKNKDITKILRNNPKTKKVKFEFNLNSSFPSFVYCQDDFSEYLVIPQGGGGYEKR